MVTGYSRWLSAVLIPSRQAEDLFAGWWQLIAALGAVPRAQPAEAICDGFAERQAALCDGPPVFRNLDVISVEEL